MPLSSMQSRARQATGERDENDRDDGDGHPGFLISSQHHVLSLRYALTRAPVMQDLGLLLLRIVAGVTLFAHGYPKLFGGPGKHPHPLLAKTMGPNYPGAVERSGPGFVTALEKMGVPYRIFVPSVAVSTAIWAAVGMWLGATLGETLGNVLFNRSALYLLGLSLPVVALAVVVVRVWRRWGLRRAVSA